MLLALLLGGLLVALAMMVTTLPALLGEDLTAITVTPQTVASNGDMSNGTTYNLLAWILSVNQTLEQPAEDIRPVWETGINMVPIGVGGDSVVIAAIARSDADNDLRTACRANTGSDRRFLIAWTHGTEADSGYFTFLRLGYAIDGHGQQVQTAEFGPCKPTGAAQVTYS